MSFTFGQPSTTTTATPAFGTSTLSGGTLFGGGDSKPFQSPSGTDNKVNYFNSPTTSAPAFSSFSFGANKTTAATPGFFTSPTTTTASLAFGGFNQQPYSGFTSSPKPAGESSELGQTATQNAPQNLSFGQTSTAQPQPFGTPTTQAQAAAPAFGFTSKPGFSLSTPGNQQTTSGFSFTPTSGFSMPQQPTATTTSQPAQSSFSLTPTTTTASGFAQSAPSFKDMFGKTSFSFAPSTSTATTTAANTTAAPSFSTTSPAFGISQPSTQPTLSFAPTQTTTGSTTTSTFQFSTTATSFANQPISSASQPTSQPQLGFAPTSTQSTPVSTQPSQPTSQPFGGSLLSKPTVPSLPGLFSGIVSSAPQITSSVASAASTAATGFSVPTVNTSATSQPAIANLACSTSGLTSGLTFAKPIVSTAATTIATTSAPTSILSLGKSTAASTMPSLTTTTITTASAPPQPISSITFSQLEENINKWTLELEEQEKIFINQATQINAWDRLLISNGEMIVELNDTIQTVKNEQQSLEHELDFVLAQQKELEEILTPIEKKLLNEMGDRLRDPEREHMYSLAENLDSQLRQMSEDLKEVIEHLNETNRSQDTNDPIVQIGRILNAHMSSMQWIDNSIAQISTKLDQLKATHDTLRRDNERSFQLTYN